MTKETATFGGVLDCLPKAVRTRLSPELQPVELPAGRVLQESRIAPAHVLFLRSGFASVTYVTSQGESGELATIGNEGLVGVSLLYDGMVDGMRVTMQAPGSGWMLRAEVAQREFRAEPSFQAMVMRDVKWLLGQIAQTAICSRHHTIERQLARWLLLGFDRIRDGTLLVTHEALAALLGVRREGVTEAAQRLQEAGAIRYSRGSIQLESRKTLEQRACECYGVLHRQYLAQTQCAVPNGAAHPAHLR
jgi:CRP-like cAMP-binding protein